MGNYEESKMRLINRMVEEIFARHDHNHNGYLEMDELNSKLVEDSQSTPLPRTNFSYEELQAVVTVVTRGEQTRISKEQLASFMAYVDHN